MSDDQIRTKVHEWVSTQGYPFEMAVEKKFKEKGFRTSISEYYEDFETKKHREIDVTARLNTLVNDRFMTQVSFRIECKYSKPLPWVLFSRKRNVEDRHPYLPLLYSNHGAYLFSEMQKRGLDKQIVNHPFYQTDRIGYGITLSLKNKDENQEDIPFKACNAAFRSAVFQVDTINRNPAPLDSMLSLTISIPVVLVDGKLFECYLQENGEMVTNEIPNGILDWRYSNPKGGSTHLHIVTREYLEKYAEMAMDFAAIFSSASNEMSDILMAAIRIEREKRKARVISRGLESDFPPLS